MGADMLLAIFPHFKATRQRIERLKSAASQPVENPDSLPPIEELHAAADALLNIDDLRDCSRLSSGDVILWYSGGMSWGDAPTDSYSNLSCISEHPQCWDLALLFQAEDKYMEKYPVPHVDSPLPPV